MSTMTEGQERPEPKTKGRTGDRNGGVSISEQWKAEAEKPTRTVRLTMLGKEVLIKEVTKSGKTGRVYLPIGWVGKTVKVVRIN